MIVNEQDVHCCCICSELNLGRMLPHFASQATIDSRLLYQTKHFVAFPSVSPLCVGHTLVFPKYHITSLAQIKLNDPGELITIISYIRERIRKIFGSTLLFEHGVGEGREGGCGITHAHLHVLPINETALHIVKSTIRDDFDLSSPKDLRSNLRDLNRQDSYLLLGDDLTRMQCNAKEKIPSQYMRKVCSKAMGIPSWNWRELNNWEAFIASYELLRSVPSTGAFV